MHLLIPRGRFHNYSVTYVTQLFYAEQLESQYLQNGRA